MQQSSQIRKGTSLPELLAPAGSPEAFRAAVAAGADAVYLSGKRFGARKFAPNFTDAEIEEAVDYAHRRDVRVYVTINTLLHDRELEDIAGYLVWLYSLGADAVLVQDTGVAALARKIVPLLPLHASTQMTIHTSGGVRWAAEQGFSRVVLARELALEEITRIAQETGKSGIGLEVFAHGALCYSYSGQCLLSSVIGGRSGNRGMCAQPCRKPYSLVIAETDEYGRPAGLRTVPLPGRFLLSPKDLCTYANLPDLVRSPVVSLKIEGRMKSAEYVAIVVSTYRKALDAIASGSADTSATGVQDLLLAFSRGFTSGYLFGQRHHSLMGRDAGDNRGICIGVVKRYDERSKTITVKTSGGIIPSSGDGLLVVHPTTRSEYGFSLNTVPLKKNGEIVMRVPRPAEPGARVYITSSTELSRRARQIMAHPSTSLCHPVPVDLAARVDEDGRLVLEGIIHTRRKEEIPFTYRSDFSMAPAQTHPIARDQLGRQLIKTGGSPFSIRNFTLAYDGNMFAPLAALNHARREFLAQAEEMLAAASRPSPLQVEQARLRLEDREPAAHPGTSGAPGSPSPSLVLSVYADSPEGVLGAVGGGCDIVCFEPVFPRPPASCSCTPPCPQPLETQIRAAYRICRDAGVRFICRVPKITRDARLDELLPVVQQLAATGINEYMVENYGTAYALAHAVQGSALSGSTGLNIFNHLSVQALSPLFEMLTLSPELSREEIRALIHAARSRGLATRFALIVQGNIESMVSEDCILQPWSACAGTGHPGTPAFSGIMDATGHIFPVRIDGECRSHIYNAVEMCLIDHLPALMEIGIGEVVIDARGRTLTYAGDMTRLYREAITLAKDGIPPDDPRIESLKDAVRCRSLGGITTGHFIRGLKE